MSKLQQIKKIARDTANKSVFMALLRAAEEYSYTIKDSIHKQEKMRINQFVGFCRRATRGYDKIENEDPDFALIMEAIMELASKEADVLYEKWVNEAEDNTKESV